MLRDLRLVASRSQRFRRRAVPGVRHGMDVGPEAWSFGAVFADKMAESSRIYQPCGTLCLAANGDIGCLANRKLTPSGTSTYPSTFITVVWMSMHNKAKMSIVRYIGRLNNSLGMAHEIHETRNECVVQ
jgi:hypothetical protein